MTLAKDQPVALGPAFAARESTQKQWAAFVKRSQLDSAPATLEEIREPLRGFLLPVVSAIADARAFDLVWTAKGPWATGPTR